jgi:drug/metabolite transporter (DMT)-like permease
MVALAGIAQYWFTRSLSLAPPSALVPFNYLSLAWATFLGFEVGGRAEPGPASRLRDRCRLGPFILWRETLRPRPAVSALPRA